MSDESLSEVFGIEFERSVVWLLLYDGDFSKRAGSALGQDLFSKDDLADLVETWRSLKGDGDPPEPRAVMASLKEQAHAEERTAAARGLNESPRRNRVLRAMARLTALGSREPVNGQYRKFVEERLGDFVKRNSIKNALIDSVALLDAGEFDRIADLVSAAAKADAVEPDLGLAFSNLGKKLNAYRGRSRGVRGVRTGLALLDGFLGDGMETGALGVLMGPTGRGKTMALVNLGVAALLQGVGVVHVTLEIPAVEVALRYDGRLTGLPVNELKRGWPDHVRPIAEGAARLGADLYICEWGSDELTLSRLRAYLEVVRAKVEEPPKLLIVDYLDLMRVAGGGDRDLRLGLGDLARGLRQVGRDFHAAVWTASQTNRPSFNRISFDLDSVAESIEKVNVADVVVGLCQGRKEKEGGKMRVTVLKNRLGGSAGKYVDCTVDEASQTIRQSRTQIPYRAMEDGRVEG